MKVLLVYPEFPDTYWSFRHALSFEGKRSAFPPLGLLTVSAMLPEHWERRLVDMNVRSLTASDIRWADVVFASAMLVQKESLKQVVALCNAAKKKIIVGGPYVTTTLEELTGADHVVLGEAEEIVPQLVSDLERGEAKAVYSKPDRPQLSLTPIPDFKLADMKRYSAMSVQYSRGCPFNCEFCDIIEIYGRLPRTKSNQQMIGELDVLMQSGWRGTVFIVDDNFIGNKKNVKLLLPDLAEWQERNGRPFTFITEASVNLAEDDKLLDLMRRAGFNRAFLGIETPVEASLKEAQKGQNTRRDLLDSVKRIQSYGIEVMAGFIVGFDNDPEDIFERMTHFIRESAIPLAMVGLLTALPNTQLWRRLSGEGRLLGESAGNNTHSELNFIPRMDSKRLVEGYKSILRSIYDTREYYDRALECLKRVSQPGPKSQRRNSLIRDVSALARITMRLGVRDRDRLEFWRFMTQTLAHHRGAFADSMRLAAMGYHFRKLTEAYCG
ncbi:MAG TPA: B12-binding domain-containing radical SAM protein [Blastocatellia bacterium]|nr:B12-binding domain-containing radical SAM protein [Blastocatellia bacterium]